MLFGYRVTALAVQPDGRVLVSGRAHYAAASEDYWLSPQLLRLMPDGSPDLSFAPYHAEVNALALLPDGDLVVAGGGVARLNSDGSLDPSLQAVANSVYALAIRPGGKILIGGGFNTVNGRPRSRWRRGGLWRMGVA